MNIVSGKTQNQAKIIAEKVKAERTMASKGKSNVGSKVERTNKVEKKTESLLQKPKLYMPNIVDPLGTAKGKI